MEMRNRHERFPTRLKQGRQVHKHRLHGWFPKDIEEKVGDHDVLVTGAVGRQHVRADGLDAASGGGGVQLARGALKHCRREIKQG